MHLIPLFPYFSNYRERKVSSEEVVTAFIERCRQVNGLLNAVVEERYDDAIKEAKEVDKMLKDEQLSEENLEKTMPLLGVPFTTKESNESKGKTFFCIHTYD